MQDRLGFAAHTSKIPRPMSPSSIFSSAGLKVDWVLKGPGARSGPPSHIFLGGGGLWPP